MRLSLFFAFLLLCTTAGATHLKGGYIRIEPTVGLTYKIVVVAYTSSSMMHFGGDDSVLDFGDGTSVVVPEQPSVEVENGLFIAQYEVLHTYSSSGKYIVSYREPNRSDGIVNLANSAITIFYLESAFVADPLVAIESPLILNYPIFSIPAGDNFSFSINATDRNDHELFFAFASPKHTTDYRLPEKATVDSKSGLMKWDTKFNGATVSGEFLFNIKVKQIRNNVEVGYIIIDFSVVVFPSGDQLIFNKRFEGEYFVVSENDHKSWKAIAYDADGLQFPTVSLTSDIGHLLTFETYDSVAGGRKITVSRVEFTHTPGLTRKDPYLITLRAHLTGQTRLQRDILITVFTQAPTVITGEEPVSISDAEAFIFPNPYRDYLQVSTPNGKDARVVLRSVDNRVYFDGRASTLKHFNTENAPVVMIYQILTDDGVFSGRLVRE